MAASMFFRIVSLKRNILCELCLNRNVSVITRLGLNQTVFPVRKMYFCSESGLSPEELKRKMESLTDKFTDARELLQDARDSQGTVYFSDDLAEAAEAVEEALKEYKELQSTVSENQKRELTSSLGLRMEELKAQQAAIQESLKD